MLDYFKKNRQNKQNVFPFIMILTLDLFDMNSRVLKTMLIFIIEEELTRTIVRYYVGK